MEFFNKKEEVIDLQLTQYGKYLLSLGKFKPIYYAFYDDGIIYDSNYVGQNEAQNNAELRIQSDTPNLKPLHNFHSIEDDMQRAVEAKNSGKEGLAQKMIQPTPDKSQILVHSLANSDLGSNKVPAWNVTLLSGKILTGSTSPALTLDSSDAILDIPQIEMEVVYTVRVVDGGNETTDEMAEAIASGEIDGIPQAILEQMLSENTEFDDINYDIRVFDDGTYFNVNRDDLIIQIMEDNVPYLNDSFEAEVFAISDIATNAANTTTTRQLEQLRFVVEPELVIDDILYDEDEIKRFPIPEIDSSFVDYFFDFETDDEIEASLICNAISNGDKDLYRFARKDFTCPDIKSNYQFLDPYAAKPEDEGCDK